MSHPTIGRALIGAFALLALGGADGCPYHFNGEDGGGQTMPQSTTGGAVDVGGTAGATWQVAIDRATTVTVRNGQQQASTTVVGSMPARVGGATIAVADFCWRSDVACPAHVLPTRTGLQQIASRPGWVIVSVGRRGPFAALTSSQRFVAELAGYDLSMSLVSAYTSRGLCGLQAGSRVAATVITDEPAPVLDGSVGDGGGSDGGAHDAGPSDGGGDATKTGAIARRIEGKVAVVYAASCLAIGGSAVLPATATVELSARFNATRTR